MIRHFLYYWLLYYAVSERRGGHPYLKWGTSDDSYTRCAMLVSAVAWGLAYGLGMVGILRAMLFMVLVDFLLVGSLAATFTW